MQSNSRKLFIDGGNYLKAGNYDEAFKCFQSILTDKLYYDDSTPSPQRKTPVSMERLANEIMDLRMTNLRLSRNHSNNEVSDNIYFKFDEGFNLRDTLSTDELLCIDVSAVYYNMGKTKESEGDYVNALGLYFDAIQGAEKRFKCNPDDHVVLVSALRSIGNIYYLFGEFTASLSAYSLALNVNKEGYDYKDNLVTASILCCIGCLKYHLHCEKGHDLDAIELEESLVIMKVLVDKDHIDIATVKNNLGRCYTKQGKIDLALRTLREALEVRRKEYGDDHLDVAATYYNLGHAQLQMFTLEAVTYYANFIRIAESKGILYYPQVARVLHTAADLYGRRGENSSMISYYRKALDIENKLHGELHKNVLKTLDKLGAAYIKVKDYEAVKFTYKLLLNKQAKIYGTSNVIVLPTMINIARACMDLDENEVSLVTYDRVLHMQKNVLKAKATDIVETLSSLGYLYKQRGDLPKAFFKYKEAFELSEGNETIEYARVDYILRQIVDISRMLNLKELRADYTLKLINFTKDNTFDCHILSFVASIYKGCHKYEKALGCYQQIFDIHARRLKYNSVFEANDYDAWTHVHIIDTICDIGEMHLMLNHRESALHQFLKALQWLQNIRRDGGMFEEDDFVADFIKKIRDIYNQAGEERAVQMYEDASIIFRAAGLNDAQIDALINGPRNGNNDSDHSAPAA